MQGRWFTGLVAILAVTTAWSQPALNYQNDGLVTVPPVIDAINFINNGQFLINYTQNFPEGPVPPPFSTYNTLNYTNLASAVMKFNTGFEFDTFDTALNTRTPAASFFNAGSVNFATLDTLTYILTNGVAAFGTPLSNFVVHSVAAISASVTATNIVNRGSINVGLGGVLQMTGHSMDMAQSSITSEGAGDVINIGATNAAAFFFNNGIFNSYWGIGDPVTQRPLFYPNGISPTVFFALQPYQTPFVDVTTRNGGGLQTTLGGPTFQAYLDDVTDFATSNRWVRAAYVSSTNANIIANVYLAPPFSLVGPVTPIVVEFTNLLATSSNNLYLFDYFGITTNFQVLADTAHGFPITGVPFNHAASPTPLAPISLFRSPFSTAATFGGILQTPTIIPLDTFNPAGLANDAITNQWAAYEAILQPTSVLLEGSELSEIQNAPGRVEVRSQFLNLSNAQVSAENYMLLGATNHFIGSQGARISSPWEDLDLRSTNGLLRVSNIIAETFPRPEGTISVYSGRWTNVTTNTGIWLTNRYHVLFVDAKISPESSVRTESLILRSTNLAGGADRIILNDVISVTNILLLDSERITIATNDAFAAIRCGTLKLLGPGDLWANANPRLLYFTNDGLHTAANAVFFGSQRTSPFFETIVYEPYQAFVNSGRITNFSSQIQANYFRNSGVVDATGGGISLESQVSVLTNGAFLATGGVVAGSSNLLGTGGVIFSGGGPITISANSLFVSNHVLAAGGMLTISATNLDDGSLAFNGADFVSNKNYWVSTGISLLSPFVKGSLLATTVTNGRGAAQQSITNRWAAVDKGNDPVGFFNNAALGQLVLDGSNNSSFTFSAAVSNNALYVDLLELRNFIAITNGAGRFTALNVTPGMKVYFGGAVANGLPVSHTLAAATPGFVWVSNFNCGFFSSIITNVGGVDYRMNYFRLVEPGPPPVFAPANCSTNSGLAVNLNQPVILSQPQSQYVTLGSPAQLQVVAAGTPSLSYQWQHEGTNLPATGSTYTIPSVQSSHLGAYRVVVSNTANAIVSATAFLVIPPPPVIITQPQIQTTVVGNTVSFSVQSESILPVSYQWRFKGTNLPGATTNPLILTNVAFGQAGGYTVLVSNSLGAVLSAKGALTVVAVASWGSNQYSPITVPLTLSNVVAVAAGNFHSVALRADGTVVAWGDNSYGQALVPAGLTNVVAIAAGGDHTLALRSDGTVAAWGSNSQDETNVQPVLNNIVAVAAGAHHSLALRADGTVASWGLLVPPALSNVVSLSCGDSNGLAVKADGTVVEWDALSSHVVDLSNVVAVAGGTSHALALLADGTVAAWGGNNSSNSNPANVPTGLSNVVAIAACGNNSLALRADGTLAAWGDGSSGQTNLPSSGPIGGIACGRFHSLAAPALGTPFVTSRLASRGGPAGGLAFFRAEANGARPSKYQWRRNGSALAGGTNAVLRLMGLTASDEGDYDLIVSNAQGVASIPSARLTVTFTALQSALDDTLPWSGDPAPLGWFAQTMTTHDGVDAAQSGPIADNQSSTLLSSIMGPGTLSFWWKVSSEPDYDFLDFYLDNSLQASISGEVSWEKRTVSIPPGVHSLKWQYIKDIADTFGLDSGWLDEVFFTPPVAPPYFAPGLSFSNGSFSMQVLGSQGATVVIQSSPNLITWTPIQTNTIPGGGLNVSVPVGTNRQQFFRALIQQP